MTIEIAAVDLAWISIGVVVVVAVPTWLAAAYRREADHWMRLALAAEAELVERDMEALGAD